MSDLLQLVVSEGAADLHLRVGEPPAIRLHGVLHRIDGPALKEGETEELARSITSDDQIKQYRALGGGEFDFAFGELARFRASVFMENGQIHLLLSKLPTSS